MDQTQLDAAIGRIRKMELCFDALQAVSDRNTACFHAILQSLLQYYESGKWMADFALDEQGLLPKDLKRGILSEDGFYNFLENLPDIKR